MAYTPFSSQGTTLSLSVSGTTTSFLEIPGVQGFDGPSGETEELDSTTLSTAGGRRTYVLGFISEGEITANGLYDPCQVGTASTAMGNVQSAWNNRDTRYLKITWLNQSTDTSLMQVLVKRFSKSAGTGALVTYNLGMRITGSISNS